MLDLVYEEPMCILVVVPSVDTRYSERPAASALSGGTFYLVKWTGYPYAQATWEPEAHLANCTKALERFEKRQTRSRYPTHEDMLAEERMQAMSSHEW